MESAIIEVALKLPKPVDNAGCHKKITHETWLPFFQVLSGTSKGRDAGRT